MLAAHRRKLPRRRRNTALASGLVLVTATVLGVVAAPPPTAAEAVLQAPVVAFGYAGVGQSARLTVDGPPLAEVDLAVATSDPDGGACTKAMSGPGVTPVITKHLALDGVGHGTASVDGALLTAGQYLYATATDGSATTAVSNCVLLGAGPPQDAHVTAVTAHSVTVAWTPTAGASGQYVRLLRRSGQEVRGEALPGSATEVTFDGLGASYLYTVSVASILYPGDDPPDHGGQLPRFVLPPFTHTEAMTRQQYHDVLGRAPTLAEWSDWYTDITGRGTFAKVRIDQLLDDARWGGARSPIIRIYRAALGRWPDAGGLTYWANRRLGGSSVRMIGTVFTQSSEFKAKYGALTNRDFVKRIYTNVLFRSPDRAGLDYWTARLDRGALNRGELVLQFSESSENVGRTFDLVGTINAYTALLRRMPTTTELSTWGGIAAPPRTDLIAHIFSTDEYAARITP